MERVQGYGKLFLLKATLSTPALSPVKPWLPYLTCNTDSDRLLGSFLGGTTLGWLLSPLTGRAQSCLPVTVRPQPLLGSLALSLRTLSSRCRRLQVISSPDSFPGLLSRLYDCLLGIAP